MTDELSKFQITRGVEFLLLGISGAKNVEEIRAWPRETLKRYSDVAVSVLQGVAKSAEDDI